MLTANIRTLRQRPRRVPVKAHLPRTRTVAAAPPVTVDEEALRLAAEQLYEMNRASLDGLREIASQTSRPELTSLARILIRQRTAHCSVLNEHRGGAKVRCRETDPAAAQVELSWLRALWCLDQHDLPGLFGAVEAAEQLLVKAYVTAARAFGDSRLYELFVGQAIAVCGARQCWEDLSRKESGNVPASAQ